MYQNICWTLNNWTEQELYTIRHAFVRYSCIGKEVGEEGTPHLQGYTELTGRWKLPRIKRELGDRVHIEMRRGTAQQAIDYCKKDGDYEEIGEPKHTRPGARTDLDRVRQMALDEGMRAVTSVGNFQQIRTAEKFLSYNEEPRDWKPEVIWLHGKSGAGKSRRARELTGDDVYTKNDGTKWWDGYDGHEHVIIDDFRCSWWSFTEMLSLLDRYEKRVEYKGGWRQFKPRLIVITSIYAPELCYMGCGEDQVQLLRRIDLVQEVQEVGG